MQIYRILNKITNKSYVGKSKDYVQRYAKHLKCADKKVNRRLYDSINFHGVDNFELILIEDLGDVSAQVTNNREIFWIKTLDTLMPNGYNMTLGGDGGNTVEQWSDEDRAELYKRQGNSRRGKRSPEFSTTMQDAATLRELNKTDTEKKIIADKISATRKEKIKQGLISIVTPTPRFGEDHPGWVYVDIPSVLLLIKDCKTQTQISETLNVPIGIIRERLRKETGKTFLDWRHEYGITGPLSRPRMGYTH